MQTFPYTKVLDYRRHVRLECRQELAAILADQQTLRERWSELNVDRQRQLDELGRLTESGYLSVDAAARRRYFTGQLDRELLVVNEQLLHIRDECELRRTVLVQADQDVQAMERLEEMHIGRAECESRRRSELELADQWQAGKLVIGDR